MTLVFATNFLQTRRIKERALTIVPFLREGRGHAAGWTIPRSVCPNCFSEEDRNTKS